jgi:hypothetical protein
MHILQLSGETLCLFCQVLLEQQDEKAIETGNTVVAG